MDAWLDRYVFARYPNDMTYDYIDDSRFTTHFLSIQYTAPSTNSIIVSFKVSYTLQ
jgi:hypothetical protein